MLCSGRAPPGPHNPAHRRGRSANRRWSGAGRAILNAPSASGDSPPGAAIPVFRTASKTCEAGMTTPASVPTISATWVRRTRFVYDHVSAFYDRGQRHMMRLKKAAVDELDLRRGDRVIAFCCGTGLELPFIRERIGPEGEILGVDWSDGMLEQARRGISDNGWANVKLYRG